MKKMLKSGIPVFVALAFLFSACAQQEPAKPGEAGKSGESAKAQKAADGKLLATVGSEKITEDSVYAPLAMMPPQFKSRYETPEGKKKLLDRAVQMSLLSQEARALKIDEKEEIARRVKEMTDQLIVQELTKQEVMDKIAVTDADMQKFYEQNKDNFKQEEKVRVDLIMFAVKEDDAQKVKGEKKAAADKALARIKKGEDFEVVAKEVSDDIRTKSRGGNTGLFGRGKRVDLYGEAFEEKAFSLPLNEVSDIFKGKDGLFIIKVMEKKPMKQDTFEEAKPQIERTMKSEKQKTAMDSYLDGLRKKYPVKMLEEPAPQASPAPPAPQGSPVAPVPQAPPPPPPPAK